MRERLTRGNIPALAALFVGVLVFPVFFSGRYHLSVATFVGIYSIVVVGLNLLMGYAGQISLGHAAFFGIGAYTSGILTAKFGLGPWPAILLGLALTFAVSLLVGLPALKLRGYYLGMATLGFGVIVYIFFREVMPLTGGSSGLPGIATLDLFGWTFNEGMRYYFLVWGLVIAVVLLSLNIVDSRVGRGLRAIHDAEAAAQASGVETFRLKLTVFTISALYASLAGSLYAHFVTFISPSTFDFMASVKMVTMGVIGGMASIWGALFGAATLVVLPELLHSFEDFEPIVLGGVLIVVMIFLPHGLWSGIAGLIKKRKYSKE